MKKLITILFVCLCSIGYAQHKPHNNNFKNIIHLTNGKFHTGIIVEINKDVISNEYSTKGIALLDKGFAFMLTGKKVEYFTTIVWSDYISDKIYKTPQINLGFRFKF